MEEDEVETARRNEAVSADVAIVGYGPTGQLLALLLARLGHRVAVVDRWPHLYPLPRAVHFNHEIARIFQCAGLVDEVMPIADRIDFYEWRNEKNDLLLQLDWSGLGQSGWPVAAMFAQPDLERLLDRHVKAMSCVTVCQGWEAKALTQTKTGVQIGIERGELRDGRWIGTGEQGSIEANWVIGADGANSFVRRALDIGWQNLGFAFDWLVIDVKPRVARDWVPNMWQLCDPARPATLVPGGPGRRRWEFMLLPGERAEDMNREDVAWKLLAPWDVTPANAELERHAVYTFRAQWATEWKRGRILLAGDAAHLMPPFAGQGMCSGMRDSMALAWRLDAVLQGRVPESVLDSYGPERSGHVRELIDFSIDLGKVVCITDREEATRRDELMRAAQARPGYAAPPPPAPSLGPGLWMAGAPGAGRLGIQAQVGFNGTRGLFDDVVGRGFALIARDADTLAAISAVNHEALRDHGAAIVHIGRGGMNDVDGSYGKWLAELDCVAAFVRPDFYVYGGARTPAEIDGLLDAWRDSLGLAAYAASGERRYA
nr:bifunctional 3-(3-hydroxy-phenyl)propionate/3-hydroxycinnamic acid hydroxylase [Paraburkholderia mimosarum]